MDGDVHKSRLISFFSYFNWWIFTFSWEVSNDSFPCQYPVTLSTNSPQNRQKSMPTIITWNFSAHEQNISTWNSFLVLIASQWSSLCKTVSLKSRRIIESWVNYSGATKRLIEFPVIPFAAELDSQDKIDGFSWRNGFHGWGMPRGFLNIRK